MWSVIQSESKPSSSARRAKARMRWACCAGGSPWMNDGKKTPNFTRPSPSRSPATVPIERRGILASPLRVVNERSGDARIRPRTTWPGTTTAPEASLRGNPCDVPPTAGARLDADRDDLDHPREGVGDAALIRVADEAEEDVVARRQVHRQELRRV